MSGERLGAAMDATRRFDMAQSSLVTQAVDMTLDLLARMIEDGSIDTSPGYQRRERWDAQRRSALIESFLLNVPIPPIYLNEESYGVYSVIDGKQRLTTVRDFLGNNMRLSGLRRFPELNGLSFTDLPPAMQSALRSRPYLRVVTLLRQSDPDLKYEVFLRLNTGGERLTAQETRNVAFEGPLNDLLIELSGNEFLARQLKIHSANSAAYRQMLDVEFVLRYLTLRDTWQDFSGNFAVSMDRFMLEHRHASLEQLEQLSESFGGALKLCEALWGEYAFKRPSGPAWRDQALAGMYDAEMVAVSVVWPHMVAQDLGVSQERLLHGTRGLFADAAFSDAVRQATNTPKSVRYRINAMIELLQAL